MGSSAFLLPMEAQGVYRAMLTQAWRRGARLPNDHEAIQRAIGCTPKEWRRTWPLVERFWQAVDGFLINETQVEVYADARARQEKASERGLRGAQAMHKHRLRTTQAQPEHSLSKPLSGAQAVLEDKPLSLSPVTDRKEKKYLEPDERWEAFKAKYPGSGRQGGFMATQLFLAACERVGVDAVMAGLERYCLSKKVHDGFVIGMEKWLEKEMWIQEPDKADSSRDDVAAMQEHLAKLDAGRLRGR